MRTCSLIPLLCLLLGGCATHTRLSDREAAAEARGYERGYRQAVKEQYWLIQNQQRRPAAPPAASNPESP
jgi:hypothetical protein